MKSLIVLGLLFSTISFASTLDCEVSLMNVKPEYVDTLHGQLTVKRTGDNFANVRIKRGSFSAAFSVRLIQLAQGSYSINSAQISGEVSEGYSGTKVTLNSGTYYVKSCYGSLD